MSEISKKQIREVYSNFLGQKPEDLPKDFTYEQLDLDSLDAVEIVMILERTFDIVINDTYVENVKSEEDMYKALEKNGYTLKD